MATCTRCAAPLKAGAGAELCFRCLAEDLLSPEYDAGAESAPATGSVLRYFGDYEFLEALSRGGMGIVYRARQVSLNRVVAVKMLVTSGPRNPAVMRRFRVEAEAAARLQHPHIVPIHEFGEYGGEPFLSMKFVEGARPLVDPTLPFLDAIDHLIDVAGAVHHAHLHGVLHRDIKPSNILVGADGLAYLTDFGLAKILDGDVALTRTAETLGTPVYMAPELARGGAREVTVATDVYGLGAILYEILTGHPPFDGETTAAVVRQVVEDDPVPPSQRITVTARVPPAPAIDRDLETITLKCLHKSPGRRYATAEALAEDLQRWRRGEPILARPISTMERSVKWVRRRPLVAASLLFVVLGLLGVTFLSVRFGRERAVESERHRRERVRLNVSAGMRLYEQRDPAAAMRQQVLALRLEEDDAARAWPHRLRLALMLRETPRLEFVLPHTGPVNSVEFSRDGHRLLSASDDGTAQLWDADRGIALGPPLAHGARVYQALLAPDGTRALTLGEDGLARLWEVPSGNELPSRWPVQGPFYKQVSLPPARFSPEGTRVFALHTSQVDLWDTTSGQRVGGPLALGSTGKFFDLSPDGRRLLVAGTRGPVQVRSTAAAAGWPLEAQSEIPKPIYGWFDPTGTRFAVIEGDYSVRVWDARSGEPRTPPMRHTTSLRLQQCAFSPDGTRLLTLSFDNTVRTWASDTGVLLTRSIQHGKGLLSARYSPDGRRVVTTSFDGSARLWDAESGESTCAVMRHASYVFDAAFDPQRPRVATAGQDGEVRVWWPMEEWAKRRFHHGARIGVAFPVDAGQAMATAGADGVVRVWSREDPRADGPRFEVGESLRVGLADPRGRWIAVAGAQKQVHFLGLKPGVTPRVDLAVPQSVSSLAVSVDGRWLAVSSREGGVRVFDSEQGAAPPWVLDAEDPVVEAQFSPTGGYLAVALVSGEVRFRAVPGGVLRGTCQASGELSHVRFRPDGQCLVTAAAEPGYRASLARLWRVPDGAAVGLPMSHFDGVMDACFSGDGRWVATAGEDGMIRVWHAEHGFATSAIMMHSHKVVRLAFSPDSRLLASASTSGEVRLWDGQTSEPISRPRALPESLVGLWFSPDGKELVLAAQDGTVEVWDLRPVDLPVAEIESRTALLNAERLRPASSFRP